MTSPTPDDAPERNYRRGALAVLPFLVVGLADVYLIVAYGVDPVWGLAVVPPIAFVCALAWIAFSTEFLEERTGPVAGGRDGNEVAGEEVVDRES